MDQVFVENFNLCFTRTMRTFRFNNNNYVAASSVLFRSYTHTHTFTKIPQISTIYHQTERIWRLQKADSRSCQKFFIYEKWNVMREILKTMIFQVSILAFCQFLHSGKNVSLRGREITQWHNCRDSWRFCVSFIYLVSLFNLFELI